MRVENQRSRELAPLNINGCFPFLTCPPSFPVPLSFLFLSSPSRRAAHTISHTHASLVVLGLGLGRDADRRKKTGSRRRIVIKEHLVAEDRKRMSRCRWAPVEGLAREVPSPTWPQSEGCPREGREGWLLEEQDRKRRCKVDANNYGRLHLCW